MKGKNKMNIEEMTIKEARDTPVIQRYGKKLANAIEGTAEKVAEER
jgi:hypothetical protein